MSSYQPNIPTGTETLDVDYLNLRGNFQQMDTTYKVDHVALTDGTVMNGYHKTVHMTDAAGDPATVTGTGILYNKEINDGINTDYELHFKSSLGNVIQLTRNFVPSAGTNGYTFLPGGLIFQWGLLAIAVGATDGTTTFTYTGVGNIAFPNNVFGGSVNFRLSGDPTNKFSCGFKTLTTTQATISWSSSSSRPNGFYWTLIGN